MEYQKALKSGIIVAAILVIAAITTTVTNVQAATGYEQGKADAQARSDYDSTCPPRLDNDETACVLYKADYERGWAAWKIAHGDDTDRWNNDDG